jgi:Protein of unknown function (DUF3152)
MGLAIAVALAAGVPLQAMWAAGPGGSAPAPSRRVGAADAGSGTSPAFAAEGTVPPSTSDGAPGPSLRGKRPPRAEVPRRPVVRTPEFVPHPTGRLRVVPGTGRVTGDGLPRRYLVEVEGGLGIDLHGFASRVEEVLGDPRGWSASGQFAFRRVDRAPASFRVTLASRGMTDRLCAPLRTNGIYSCFMDGRAVLNVWRWKTGADSYGRNLAGYRRYLVNHEVGHALGQGHRYCPAAGRPAPVMMQQTKGVAPCEPHEWPLPYERP